MKRHTGGVFTVLLAAVVLVLLAGTALLTAAAFADRNLAKGRALLEAGHYDQALPLLQKAEKYNTYLRRDDAEVTKGIAESYFGLGQDESAMHYYSRLAGKKPEDVEVQYNLGILYVRLREYDKAEEQVRKLQQLGQHDAEADAYAGELSDVLQKTMMKGLFKGLFDRISPHLPELPSYLFDPGEPPVHSGDETQHPQKEDSSGNGQTD